MSNHIQWPEQWKAVLTAISSLADCLDMIIAVTDDLCDDMSDDITDPHSPSTEDDLDQAFNFQRMAGLQLALLALPILHRSQCLALWSEDEDYWVLHEVLERFLAVHDLPPVTDDPPVV